MISVIIPIYNHPSKIENICKKIIQETGLNRIFLVNDGSDSRCTAILRKIALNCPQVHLIEHKKNLGKGSAVLTGLIAAEKEGFTHAFQIDADGQHDLKAIPNFINATEKFPKSAIVGYPIYDHTVPTSRLIGRYATHIWVWINTLSFNIKDSMCGFRIYPLDSTMKIIDSTPLGTRMEFDTEILVRLSWQGVKFINLPVHVVYPIDGTSQFRLLKDNLLISWMHTRLFFGMLKRLPSLLLQKKWG